MGPEGLPEVTGTPLTQTLAVVSVHFDHEDPEARVESGKLMKKKISEIAGNAPVICTHADKSHPENSRHAHENPNPVY